MIPDALNYAISSLGSYAPVVCVALFVLASLLVVWRLEVLSSEGVEGTVLGTLFMPFCSGMGNLIFALLMTRHPQNGGEVVVNSLFNNITNLTLLIGLPVLIWNMGGIPRKQSPSSQREYRMGRLALCLNLSAALFFSLFTYLLALDGAIGQADGVILIALFFFWQIFHIYDVKKTNLLKKTRYPRTLPLEVVLLLLGAAGVFISTDWLVSWFQSLQAEIPGLPPRLLGWMSGILMVLPNALLAFYYGARNRMDVVYTSQSGDAHICVPLGIGLFAVFHPIPTAPFLLHALILLMGLSGAHLLLVLVLGRLPRFFALLFVLSFFLIFWAGRI
jgi:cation:H+ antiporter